MQNRPAPPPDPELPVADRLLDGEASAEVLARFLDDRGWRLLDHRVTQALYRPTRACTVRYAVRALPPKGFPRQLSLCATARRRSWEITPPPSDFGLRFGLDDPLADLGDGTLLWAYPYDPRLPGLVDAAHGMTVRRALGLARPAVVSVTSLRYRPGQRAALRYTVLGSGGRQETLFGKVVGADAYGRIFDAYRTFAGSDVSLVPPRELPAVPGAAVFPEMAGQNLRDLIEEGGPLPAPSRLIDVLEDFAEIPWRGEAEPATAEGSIRVAGRLLAHLLPHRAGPIRDAYRRLAELAARPVPSGMTVHGDFYEGQIFVRDDFSIGLIDLEDGGPGDPLLDAANILAHMDVLHFYDPGLRGRSMAYRHLLRREILDRMGGHAAELDWRESACLLLLATGPFRVQSPTWPRDTERLLDWALDLLDPVRAAA